MVEFLAFFAESFSGQVPVRAFRRSFWNLDGAALEECPPPAPFSSFGVPPRLVQSVAFLLAAAR